jgi:choline kinase
MFYSSKDFSMPKEPYLLVMAAGIGSRYGGLKQIEPVGPSGEIILDYALYDAMKAGFRQVVFVIRKDIEEAFREKIGSSAAKHLDVTYVFQSIDDLPQGFAVPADRTKPWGTGHAVLSARRVIDAPFAVINADDFYGSRSFAMLYSYLKNARDAGGLSDYCMVGYVLANTLTEHGHVARGVCAVSNDGFLESIVERTKIQRFSDAVRYCEADGTWVDIEAQSIVSMNMLGFTPSYLRELEQRFPLFLRQNGNDLKAELFVPTVVNQLIHEKRCRVKVLPTPDAWLGVTYKEDREAVRQSIRVLVDKGAYPEKLWT